MIKYPAFENLRTEVRSISKQSFEKIARNLEELFGIFDDPRPVPEGLEYRQSEERPYLELRGGIMTELVSSICKYTPPSDIRPHDWEERKEEYREKFRKYG